MQTNIEPAERAEVTNQGPSLEPRVERRRLSPPMDVYENADEYVLLLDVPGVNKDQVKLEMEQGVLTLSAIRTLTGAELEYHRVVSVSESIDPAGIRAELDRGVLTVHLAKRAELKSRRIEIQ